MLKGQTLLDYTNTISPDYEKNDEIILEDFQ